MSTVEWSLVILTLGFTIVVWQLILPPNPSLQPTFKWLRLLPAAELKRWPLHVAPAINPVPPLGRSLR